MSIDVSAEIAALVPEMIAIRRDLHQHPELAFEETRTAEIITAKLTELGYQVYSGLGQTGVVGFFSGGRAESDAKNLLIRADIDALPVQEANQVEYRSQEPGKMHACGHDGHIAIGLGVAAALAAIRAQLPFHVTVLFQPAEERAGGAMAMTRDGVFEKVPHPDAVIGLHLWSPFHVGTIGVKAGPIFASADEFIIRVRGKGGHGAMPELSVDPIVASAHIVTALQTLISREIAPSHRAVVTVGAIHGGTAFNIIADEVILTGTVRAYDPADRAHIMKRIGEVAAGVAMSLRAECTVGGDLGIPPCVNDAGVAAVVRAAAAQTVGESNIIEDCMQTVGDDMAHFLETAPGCYFLVGAGNPEEGIQAPHHSALFNIDENSLRIGAETLVRAALLLFP